MRGKKAKLIRKTARHYATEVTSQEKIVNTIRNKGYRKLYQDMKKKYMRNKKEK